MSNLAACALHSRKFARCVLLADYALALETDDTDGASLDKPGGGLTREATPASEKGAASDVHASCAWKAGTRKGLALIEMGDYGAARIALREACARAHSEADQRSVRRELQRLHALEQRQRARTAHQARNLSQALGGDSKGRGLYADVRKKQVSALVEVQGGAEGLLTDEAATPHPGGQPPRAAPRKETPPDADRDPRAPARWLRHLAFWALLAAVFVRTDKLTGKPVFHLPWARSKQGKKYARGRPDINQGGL